MLTRARGFIVRAAGPLFASSSSQGGLSASQQGPASYGAAASSSRQRELDASNGHDDVTPRATREGSISRGTAAPGSSSVNSRENAEAQRRADGERGGATADADDSNDAANGAGAPQWNETVQRYAKLVRGMTDYLTSAQVARDWEPELAPSLGNGSSGGSSATEAIATGPGSTSTSTSGGGGGGAKFARIRGAKEELLITPGDEYILAVIQDPAH